ncbi:hypothetical protein VTJ83DRAFT_233 [Remersonia thermophila]|uniref:DUF7707 domain-containing protein n=1 Tax=Remersonia thermophila TaxID=72144 RepID=A0ABR4DKM6_9PEZI
MVSFRTTLLALAAATTVAAQRDYWVDPESIPLSTRRAWCNDQRSSCRPICLETSPGNPLDNTCDPETLTYGCVCSDGRRPNVSEYTLTLPYHVCTAWGTQCVESCGSNNQCAADCREQNPCGAQNPKKPNATSTSSTVASTAEPTATPTGQVFDGMADGSETNDKDSGAGLLRFGDSYGVLVLAGGLFAGLAGLL